MIDAFIGYILQVITATAGQVFVLMGPGLILALLLNLIGEVVRTCTMGMIGYRAWLYFFKGIGTPIHELSHAFFAVLFGHRVEGILLFNLEPDIGIIGAVAHSYHPNNLFQRIGNFFIGLGPILIGSALIYLMAVILLGPGVFTVMKIPLVDASSFGSLESAWDLASQIYQGELAMLAYVFSLERLLDFKFYLFLYIAFSVGNSLTLSIPDIEGMLDGLITLVSLLLVFNLFTLWLGDFSQVYFQVVGQSFGFYYAIMIFVLVVNAGFALALAPVYGVALLIRRRLKGKEGDQSTPG